MNNETLTKQLLEEQAVQLRIAKVTIVALMIFFLSTFFLLVFFLQIIGQAEYKLGESTGITETMKAFVHSSSPRTPTLQLQNWKGGEINKQTIQTR